MDSACDGLHKIHVDVAVHRDDYKGAMATICRDHEGNFVGASVMMLHGMLDPEVLECLAVREAFALDGDLQIHKVHVVTYCIAMVNHLQSNYRGASSTIIDDIKLSMEDFEKAKVEHESRA